MTHEESTMIIYLPLILSGLYLLYLLLKPESKSDQFFINYDSLSKITLIEKIELLEKLNGMNYEKEKEKISKIKDGKFSNRGSEMLEEILTNTYFNGFEKRWIAFKKADLLLKLIYILSLVVGFYIFGYILFLINSNDNNEVDSFIFLIPIILFPFSLLISLIYLGFMTIVFTLLRFVLPKNGALIRANVHLDELIKALKPGGRNTRIEIPYIDWSDSTWWV